MLFNSYIFIFAFFPITVLLYFLLAKHKNLEAAIVFLVIASLFFYGWWNPVYLILILLSTGVNYFIGEAIVRCHAAIKLRKSKYLLICGIVFNFALLGYYKYANFIIDNTNMLFGSDISISEIVLPLAISFFTFQQVAYLIDAYKGITKEFKFSHYVLFVTFFPQLIAGPIVHHKEMLPQFMTSESMRPRLENIIIGLNIFTLGLFKKIVFADSIAEYSTQVFVAAESGEPMTFFVAWGGALAYTFQLYFDFSGYSDMAIGIARIFGIHLPLNFSSPYKSLSVIEFWRRWHMTLSRFLRDYVYFTLGGNRKGNARRYVNLFATMLLGGLWHGAGWTFILWGGLHGFYLVINHGWHFVKQKTKLESLDQKLLWRLFCWFLTFVSTVNAWVFFRATSFESAIEVLKGMYGFNSIALPNAVLARLGGVSEIYTELGGTSYLGGGAQFIFTYTWVVILLIISLVMPNTQQIMQLHLVNKNESGNVLFDEGLFSNVLTFRYTVFWAFVMATTLVISVFGLSRVSEFLYFQF